MDGEADFLSWPRLEVACPGYSIIGIGDCNTGIPVFQDPARFCNTGLFGIGVEPKRHIQKQVKWLK